MLASPAISVVRVEHTDEGTSGDGEDRLRMNALSQMPTARPAENLEAMVERVGAQLDRRVIVFDGPRLVGIVSPNDLARIVRARQALGWPTRAAKPVQAR